MLGPSRHLRLSDHFWQMAGAFLILVLAIQSCRYAFTSAEQREAERERMELLRDGD